MVIYLKTKTTLTELAAYTIDLTNFTIVKIF